MVKKTQEYQQKLRIIGGQWRRRLIPITSNPSLRPTSDRIRETLFNWLSIDVQGARCLDLFAGSGALGIEALSRGAKETVFVESDRLSTKTIADSLAYLKAASDSYQIKTERVETYLAQSVQLAKRFDIIFLDPPFKQNWWEKIAHDVFSVCHSESIIYLEVEKSLPIIQTSNNWSIFREKTAGQVRYYLLKPIDSEEE